VADGFVDDQKMEMGLLLAFFFFFFNYSEKRKAVEGEDLLPQLIVYIVEEMSVKIFMRKLESDKMF
jgi:hypothetical protein